MQISNYCFSINEEYICVYVYVLHVHSAVRKPSNSSSVNDTDYSEENVSKTMNAIDIPARTFENITGSRTGVFFSLYADNALFPIRLNQTESENTTYKAIGSAVLSATLAGQEIKGLIEPINITLSITLTVSFKSMRI